MVYENISTGMKASCSTMTQSTEKQAISTQTDKVKPALQKEGSFVRTGNVKFIRQMLGNIITVP